MQAIDEVFTLFGARGGSAYVGEPVSVLEHGLQAAAFARQESAPLALVLAALLHDVGHLVEPAPEDLAEWDRDARHEQSGARWLADRFGAAVAEPVRLHVAAKRYLCATDPGYLADLSPASRRTLELQGGPMPAAEMARFEADPHHAAALRLRRWDDRAKIAGLTVPGLHHYRGALAAYARR